MERSHVTITLGRSGQRVVKEPWGESEGKRSNVSVASGIKRSLAESSGGRTDASFRYNSKRMREDASASNYGHGSVVGPRDLRLKLMSRRREREIEERKKKELCESVSRTIRSMESPERSLPRGTPVSKAASDRPRTDSLGSHYASQSSEVLRTKSPDRVLRYSTGISTPRSAFVELRRVPSMGLMDASRSAGAIMGNPFVSSRARVPTNTTTAGTLDSGKLIRELRPTAGMPRSPYTETQTLTVTSLLNSLGLGKYVINFQAEEIDMLALKQMGDRDLKELSIPMGPRKKILLAVQAQTKRSLPQR